MSYQDHYYLNNPLRFIDPSRFRECEPSNNCLSTSRFNTPFIRFLGNVFLTEKQVKLVGSNGAMHNVI